VLTSVRKLQWAASCGLPMDEVLCATLAAKGQLIELSWVRAHGCEWDDSCCYEAAKVGARAIGQLAT